MQFQNNVSLQTHNWKSIYEKTFSSLIETLKQPSEPPHDKPTKWHVRPVKTQISLGIRPVWSESSLSAWRKLGSLATHWKHSEDWSDWADAQADLSLRWAYMTFCWFCHDGAPLISLDSTSPSGRTACLYQKVCIKILLFIKGLAYKTFISYNKLESPPELCTKHFKVSNEWFLIRPVNYS